MTIERAGELAKPTVTGSNYPAAYKAAVAVIEAYEAAGVVASVG